MTFLICANCEYAASLDFVNMADTCPRCHTTPFPEANGLVPLDTNPGRTIGDHGADEALRGVTVGGAYGIYPELGLPVSGDTIARGRFFEKNLREGVSREMVNAAAQRGDDAFEVRVGVRHIGFYLDRETADGFAEFYAAGVFDWATGDYA